MSEPVIHQLLARFRANPDVRFSPEEVAALAEAAPTDVSAAQAVALNRFVHRDYSGALKFAESVLARRRDGESVVNVVVCLREMGRFGQAVEVLEAHREAVEPIRYYGLLSGLMGALGNIAEAVYAGDKALELKDRPAAHGASYRLHEYDVQDRSRNVIAFSVWGSDPRYLNGAVNNAIVARYLYPGWTARFYTNDSTPEAFRNALRSNAAEVAMTDLPAEDFGLFWRFLVEDDPKVAIYVVRDADSVMNVKERAAVARWLESGRAFHVMRDSLAHNDLMLAGMWGAHRGNIGDMRERIARYVAELPRMGNYQHKDQHFLRDVVWPIAKGSLLTHDRFFNFMEPERFPPQFDLPNYMHVGQNDWVHFKPSPRAAPASAQQA